jgi:hypothetical protein
MTITLDLGPDEERKLAERAARSGQGVTAYVHHLIARDLQGVDEALAPFRRQVEEGGMSDEELESFFEDVRDEVWQEKHGRSGQAS